MWQQEGKLLNELESGRRGNTEERISDKLFPFGSLEQHMMVARPCSISTFLPVSLCCLGQNVLCHQFLGSAS